MADKTTIEWTEATWNPITGCSVVSPGCTNCYAMTLAGTRLAHHPSRAGLTRDSKAGPVWTGEVRFNEQWLDQPLRWKRPRMIFVCAHGDLFHESVPDEWIDRVFAVMTLAPQHTFQVLTKRAERMRSYVNGLGPATISPGLAQAWRRNAISDAAADVMQATRVRGLYLRTVWPLPNVWLGVSAEDQARADERIPHLLATPAAVRWVSAEPLLGPLDLHRIPAPDEIVPSSLNALTGKCWPNFTGITYNDRKARLDWVVAGGESGPDARPMHPAWARSLRDQCAAAGVPFFFKQWGEWIPMVGAVDALAEELDDDPEISRFDHRDWNGYHWGEPYRPMWCDDLDPDTVSRVGKRRAGALLDGVEHKAWPELRS